MSDKHELTLADFEAHDVWTWDEDADDCSLIPVAEIPYCNNGEIDLGVLFIRALCKSSDDREWTAIIGVKPDDFSVYWIHVFSETGNCAWNLHLPDLIDAIEFKKTLGEKLGRVFPIAVESYIASLSQTVTSKIPLPVSLDD